MILINNCTMVKQPSIEVNSIEQPQDKPKVTPPGSVKTKNDQDTVSETKLPVAASSAKQPQNENPLEVNSIESPQDKSKDAPGSVKTKLVKTFHHMPLKLAQFHRPNKRYTKPLS